MLIIIRLLNIWAKTELGKQKEQIEQIEQENQENTKSYEEQSKSIISGGKVDKIVWKTTLKKLINF